MKLLLILLLLSCSVQAQISYPRYEEAAYLEDYAEMSVEEKAIEDQRRVDEIAYDLRSAEIRVRNQAILQRHEGIVNFKAAWNRSFHNSNYRHGFRQTILRERDDVKAFARLDKLEAEDVKYQQYLVVKNRKRNREKARPNYRKWIEAKLNNDQAALDAFQVKWDAFKLAHP